MACFVDINVSQGSAATYARCGGIFNNSLTTNLPRNLPVKKNLKVGSDLTESWPRVCGHTFLPTILALEMASPGNQHCAICIGTLSFPMTNRRTSLKGEDLVCYSNKIELIGLRKCSYDHYLTTNKTYLSDITLTNIYQIFTHKMAAQKKLA